MSVRAVLVLFLTIYLSILPPAAQAQNPRPNKSELCTQQNSLETINQQILYSRTFNNAVNRIAVLLEAADLLWPIQKEKSLATFTEAFDLANQNYKEAGDADKKATGSQFLRVEVPDQRHVVVTAVAKRDERTARRFLDQIIQDDSRAAQEKPNSDTANRNGDKILSLARSLIKTNVVSAVNFAQISFKYKATFYLPLFLFDLAKTHRNAADYFYLQALNNYSAAPMDQFLFLSSYPFGNQREAGDMPGSAFYPIPEGYVGNVAHQRAFIQKLLARAETALAAPVDNSENYRLSDLAQMWLAFSRLEEQIRTNIPDLADSSAQSKERIFSLLSPTSQQRVSGTIVRESGPKRTFDELVEAAEKKSDVGTRDRDLTNAITSSSKEQSIERVLSVIDKISDSAVREALTNWFYVFRAQALAKDKKFTEARELATKVVELDQRAYLFSQIAEGSLKENEDQTQARELLNEIGMAAAKAPKTVVTARALLALAYLYSKIDANRGIEELANAVRVINGIENPDFSAQYVMLKIEGKTFGSYAAISTPGFNPQTAFSEVSKVDFDGALNQAATFSDKGLRSLTTLSVVEPCLAVTEKSKPAKPKS